MYTIKTISDASEEIIKTAIEMDHAAFETADWITEEDAKLIYHSKKDCLIWLSQEDKPIGFVTIFPLSESLPERAIKENKLIYKLLTKDALENADTSILYCHCFLILPAYRGKGLIYKLYGGLLQWLEEKGAGYASLYADAVSADGRRCLERLGFSMVHSFGKEGMLYKAEKQDVIKAIRR